MSSLGYVDRCARTRVMVLPRKPGETREAYARRFTREVTGLGHVHIVTVRGKRTRIVATRGW